MSPEVMKLKPLRAHILLPDKLLLGLGYLHCTPGGERCEHGRKAIR